MKSKTTFAEWLRAYGIASAAKTLGVSERTVYYWLSGKVRPSNTVSRQILATAPHLSLNDIMGIPEVR